LATISKVAEEAVFAARAVDRAGEDPKGDPNGRRVAALRTQVARLHEVVQSLDGAP
jgi:hypothetical protein